MKERGDKGGLETREERRERGGCCVVSVELQFRAGWSVGWNRVSTTNPLRVCVLRLNVTIIAGKAVHTHAVHRGGTRGLH